MTSGCIRWNVLLHELHDYVHEHMRKRRREVDPSLHNYADI